MKNLVLSLLIIFTSSISFSQKDSSYQKKQTINDPLKRSTDSYQGETQPHIDYVTLKNGKMVVWKDGKMSPMITDMVLNDGTKITITGSVIRTDGTIIGLKEGDRVDMSGKIKALQPNSKP